MQSISVGMTRAAVAAVFVPAGGLSTPNHQTYEYRRCSYFRVDVEFSLADHTHANAVEDPNDTVMSISKPYMAWTTSD
jgi:hypothetical protein